MKDIAGQTFDGEILMHSADLVRLRLEHDVVVGRVRNRAAGSNRGQASAAAGAQHAVDCIAMQVGRSWTSAGGKAFGEHAHDVAEGIYG